MRSRSVNKRSISSNGEANFASSSSNTMNTTSRMGIEESNTSSPMSGSSSSHQALHHHHQTSNHLSQRRGTSINIASASTTNSTGIVLSSPPTSGSIALGPRTTPTRSSWMKKWFLRLLVCITIIWWIGTFSIQILSLGGSSSTTSSLSSTSSDIPNKKYNNDASLFDQDGTTSNSNSETFQTAMQTLTHKLLEKQDDFTKKSTHQPQDKGVVTLRARKQEKMSSDSDNNADASLMDHNVQPKNSTFRIVYDAKHVDVVADAMFDVERKAFRSHNTTHIVLAGIVRHTNEMSERVWTSLIEFNCHYNISIHIVVAEGFDVGYQTYQTKKLNLQEAGTSASTTLTCAPFILHPEPVDLVSSYPMRVDKIAILRDYQRELLQKAWYNQLHGNRHKARIILADLDLLSFPNTSMVMSQLNIDKSSQPSSNFDVICSAGVMHRPFGYYDIFATILNDNTFVYPMRGRLTQKSNSGNPLMIRSDDIYGKVTQYDLLSYFEEQSLLLSQQQQQREGTDVQQSTRSTTSSFTSFANSSNITTFAQGNVDPLNITLYNSHYLSQFDSIVPVQSCFGGFAVYNATKFFHSRCSYSAPYKFYNQDPSMKKRPKLAHEEQTIFQQYSSKRSKRPCEHVVFHKCLARVYYDHYQGGQDFDPSNVHEEAIKIGILPSWRTEWDAPLREPGANETHVLKSSTSRHDGLNTYYNQRLLGERLISPNQRYTLRINDTGQLVIEDWYPDTDISAARNETNTNTKTMTRLEEQPRHLRLPSLSTTEDKSSSMMVGIDSQSNNYDTPPNNKGKIVWSNPINTFETESLSLLPSTGWTHMFLWLQDNGSIKLIQHVPLSTIKSQHSQFHKRYCENVKSETPVSVKSPCICQVKIDGCEILLWSVAAPSSPETPSSKKKHSSNSFALHLNDDASLILATGDENQGSGSKKCITVIVQPTNASHNATAASEL